MTAQKRNMTMKGFLHKANITKGALGFLAAHREYLTTGEYAAITSPIVAQIDSGKLMATPGLAAITKAVYDHMIVVDDQKALEKMQNQSEPAEPKNYQARILTAKGEIATKLNDKGEYEDLVKEFDLHQRAEEWCDRRLFDGETDWYGEVVACKLQTANGPMITHVNREISVEKILKGKRGPVMHKANKSNGKLSFGVKCNNDVSKFSHG